MALSYVGSNAAATSSVALPTFTSGDIAITFAFRDGSATAPSLPSGWTNISASGGNSCSARIGYRVLPAGATTTGTWTNATEVEVIVLRGQHPVSPIGGNAVGGASSNQLSYTGFTLSVTDATSWIVGAAGHRSATDVNSPSVSGMTKRSAITALGLHTAEAVSSFSTSSYSTTVDASSGWRSYAVEVIAHIPKTTGTARLSLTTGQRPESTADHIVSLRARVTSAVSATIIARLYEVLNGIADYGEDDYGSGPYGGEGAARSPELESSLLTTAFAEYQLPIDPGDAEDIVSYSDLELWLRGYSALGDVATFEVSEAALTIPRPATGEVFGKVGSVVTPFTITVTTSGSVSSPSTKSTGIARLSLDPGFVPATRIGHTIEIRARKTNGAHSGRIRAQLYEGATARTSVLESGDLTTSLADYSLTIATAEAATITSYADLELRVWGYASTGTSTVFEIADVAMVIPVEATGSGDVTGQLVLGSTVYISVGGGVVPLYPSTSVYPHPLITVSAVSSIVVTTAHQTSGSVLLPLTLAVLTAGDESGAREGAAVFASTSGIAIVGRHDGRGQVVFASVATVSVFATAPAQVTDSLLVAGTATISVAGVVAAPPAPPGFVALESWLPEVSLAIDFDSEPLAPFYAFEPVTEQLREVISSSGRQFELDRIEAGSLNFTLDNRSGEFSPENTASAYYPNLIPTRRVRWQAYWDGVTYDLFTGFLEGYPQSYPASGFDAIVRQTAVDAFMALAVAKLLPASTTLDGAIGAATAGNVEVIYVGGTGLPMPQAVPFEITIGEETLTVEAILTANTYRVIRGDGIARSAGTPVTTEAVSFGEEYSGTRIRNILLRIGIPPERMTNVGTGQSLLAPSEDLAGQMPLEHILFVAEVEGGRFFAAPDGSYVFRDRHWVFKNNLTPIAIFGDGDGELPYSDILITHEQEHIYNIVRITAASGHVFEARDEQSINDHFERVLEKSWPLADDNEAAAAAIYLLSRYKSMQVRIPELLLQGAAAPDALWPVLLALELGTKYRVIRRPTDDAPIDKELIVEGVSFSGTPADIKVRTRLSLADPTHYWLLEVTDYGELDTHTRLGY